MHDKEKYLVVAYGMGLDSTAMLVEMYNRAIRPDLILFADTGGEKPETYAYLPIINKWLESVGFPRVTVVRYKPVRAAYETLEGKCLANDTMPELVFNSHNCSIVFKAAVVVKYMKQHRPILDVIARGEKIIKVIGYDDSSADRKRSAKAKKNNAKKYKELGERLSCGKAPLADQWVTANCDIRFPLQDWGLERAALADIIQAEGLPVPVKSACFFCPANKPEEVVDLKNKHPELYARACGMERNYHTGKHAKAGVATKIGLGISGWSWKWLADCKRPEDAAAILRSHGIKIKERLRP